MDWTPVLHAGAAVAVQVAVGITTGNWWLGGLICCTWWAAREHTQAEYRWAHAYGSGKRTNMPWWGGFDTRVWNLPSILDFAVPIVVCSLVFLRSV